jgi:hypothetical protein
MDLRLIGRSDYAATFVDWQMTDEVRDVSKGWAVPYNGGSLAKTARSTYQDMIEMRAKEFSGVSKPPKPIRKSSAILFGDEWNGNDTSNSELGQYTKLDRVRSESPPAVH